MPMYNTPNGDTFTSSDQNHAPRLHHLELSVKASLQREDGTNLCVDADFEVDAFARLLLWRQERAQTAPPGGYCAAVLSAAMLMLLLCRFLQAFLPLYGLFLIAVSGAMALHCFVLRRRLPGSGLLWYLLAVIWGVSYLLLTALPPGFGIFLSPGNIPAMIPF